MSEASSPVDPRRHDLDALRAIAMLLGIALHGAMAYMPAPWPVQDSHQNGIFGLFLGMVHGFRMPLFFLLSGFFTAMLWRRRGLGSLLKQRFRRIFLPLVLAGFTILPLMNLVSGLAISTGMRDAAARAKPVDPNASLWAASRAGDLEAIERHLENGAPIDGLDPEMGLTPLTMTALTGKPEAAALLVEKGADVGARNRDGTVPLHGAAFFGRAEIVELLLEQGVSPLTASATGDTPLGSIKADWGTTEFIAGIVRVSVDQESVMAGREAVSRLFDQKLASMAAEGGTGADTIAGKAAAGMGMGVEASGFGGVIKALQNIPILGHLWFLWILCILVAGFALCALLIERFNLRIRWPSLINTPLSLLWLLPLTWLPQSAMSVGTFGPDTTLSIIPMPQVVIYYAIFFGFGALYYCAGDVPGRLGRHWWLALPVALLVLFPLGIALMFAPGGLQERIGTEATRGVASLVVVAYAWLMTFGSMGLFRKLLHRESSTMRYLSDSAYWLYLAHTPLIVAMQWAVRGQDWPAGVKFLVVCVTTSALLLLSYETLVRYTWIGRLLNGPRARRGAMAKSEPASLAAETV